MKLLSQFAAVVLALSLAVPPAVAQAMCRVLEPGPQASMSVCCSGMGHAAMQRMERIHPETALRAVSCPDGCCTVMPQTPPEQTATDKERPLSAELSACTPAPLSTQSDARPIASTSASGGSLVPIYVLLRTFRI